MGKVSLIDGHIDEEKNVCQYCGVKVQKGKNVCANCYIKRKRIRQIKQMLNDAKSEVDTK